MISQFSKSRLATLAALLVAASLPVLAEGWAQDTAWNCPAAATHNGLLPALKTRFPCSPMGINRLGLAERPEPRAEIEAWQRNTWRMPPDVGGGDQRAGGGRLARLLHHVTWSWVPTLPHGDSFNVNAMPNRP
jgi:hypothetical protein